jgi:hypothetical protein
MSQTVSTTLDPASPAVAQLRQLILSVLMIILLLARVPTQGQTPVTTWHYDNARTSANTTESLLTPSNVNRRTFGKLFTQPVDGFVVAQPLYLPGISISSQGTHNVVFVATMHDSVYAFDAENPNASPFWMTSILAHSPAGATTVPATVKQATGTTGWTEIGIVSTPVIDPATGTLYLVAETYENGQVMHRLHALDVSNGQEKFGGPATIAATYTLNGVTSTFKDFFQLNRPGLLLANGHIYIAFGSNCCNAFSQGWVMSYNASTLQQEGAYDAEPGKTLASIWQKGAGISADGNGNIYAETGEGFYAPGANLSTSVLKLAQIGTTLSLADWFTPFNHQYLSANDQDLAQGVVILPDQPGPFPHELIAIGKQGTVYVLNRDSMGHLCSACTTIDTQIVQELPTAVGRESGTPVYWNDTVYFTGTGVPVMAYTLNNGILTVPPSGQSIKMGGGGHALVTSSGTSNALLWFNNGTYLVAMDAGTLKILYASDQAPNGRDTLPPLAHFATPIVADGKVFVGTQNSLVVYGLLPALTVIGGNRQSAAVATALPVALNVQAVDSYTQNTVAGLSVTFIDGGKGGIFNPSAAVTDQTGFASTSYTLPTRSGTYALTASTPGYVVGTFTETALPGPAKGLFRRNGNNQSAPVTTPLPAPVITEAEDSYGNGVPGVVVTYSDTGSGGTFSNNPMTTDGRGLASVNYMTSTTAGVLSNKIIASAPGLAAMRFSATVTAGPAASIAVSSGSVQSAKPSTQLAQPLVVKVTDRYGNAVSGVAVTFNDGGAGGGFSSTTASTSSNGLANVTYTTPANPGTVTIQAVAAGVSAPATFTLTVQ